MNGSFQQENADYDDDNEVQTGRPGEGGRCATSWIQIPGFFHFSSLKEFSTSDRETRRPVEAIMAMTYIACERNSFFAAWSLGGWGSFVPEWALYKLPV